MRLILLLLFLPLAAMAKWSNNDCEDRLLPVADGTRERFVFGSATYLNLSLLKEYESISPEVRQRFDQEVRAVEHLSRRQAHEIALAYHQSPDEPNRLKLFNAMRILVPIASRHLLARLNGPDDLEDYFQVGYAGLWQALPNVPKIAPRKMKSLLYWEGVANGLRKQIFYNMRRQFRTQYSLTPVSFAKGSEFSFEEEILLFGFSPEERAKIAADYGRKAEEAEAEWQLQMASVLHHLQTDEATEPASAEEQIEEEYVRSELKQLVDRSLLKLPPRVERILRMSVMAEMTLEQVGNKIGVTKERIRQQEMQGLRVLMHPAYSRKLKEYQDGFYDIDDPKVKWDRIVVQSQRKQAAAAAKAWEAERAKIERQKAELAQTDLRERELKAREKLTQTLNAHKREFATTMANLYRLLDRYGTEYSDLQESAKGLERKVTEAKADFFGAVDTLLAKPIASATKEAELIQDRNRRQPLLQTLSQHLSQFIPKIRDLQSRIEETEEEKAKKIEITAREVSHIAQALEAMVQLQDKGNSSPIVESQRAELARQLKLKREELDRIQLPFDHEIQATLSTLRIIIKQGP